ncbi:MAG: hypothetical protein ACLR8P_14990 [Clostridium fessum]
MMNYLLRFHREPQEIIVANASLSVVSYDRSTGMGKLLALNETGTLEQKNVLMNDFKMKKAGMK